MTKVINWSTLRRKLEASQETPNFQDKKLKGEVLKTIEGNFLDVELCNPKNWIEKERSKEKMRTAIS